MSSQTGDSAELVVTIGLLVFAAVASVFIGAALIMGLPDEPPSAVESPPQQDFNVPTAREAYPPALTLARELDPQAELASAVGAWSPGVLAQHIESGRTGWTFALFLPQTREMALIVVNQQQEAELIERSDWLTDPVLLSDQFWQLDSPIVGGRFMEVCQEAWQQNPAATVEYRLSTAAVNGRIVWVASLLENNNLLCDVRVDATSGRVLP